MLWWTMKWSTAYINDLPDSAFLYIESGGRPDADGKTVPRSLRHFPVRDADGRLDVAHLRNAIARAPQSQVGAETVSKVQAKARSLLASLDCRDKISIGEVRRTPSGGLRIPAALARTGVQTYRFPDGTVRREYRSPEEVRASLESFSAAAVTIGHPPEGEITPDNWGDLSVGQVADIAELVPADGQEWVQADLTIQRADAVAAVESKKLTELSVGYWRYPDPTPGITADGEEYDAVQRGIVVNHVALLGTGLARAGRGAKLYLDSAPSAEAPMKVVIDGIEYEVGSPSHISALESKLGASEARADGLAAKLTEADAKLAALDSLVEARAGLVAQAKGVLGAEYNPTGRSDRQVRIDCLAKLRPGMSFDSRDDSFVTAYLEATVTQPAPAPAKPAETSFAADDHSPPAKPTLTPAQLIELKQRAARSNSYM